jgi:hypothetical protein
MPTTRQSTTAKANVKKARRAWQDMSAAARARSQPHGRSRAKPTAAQRRARQRNIAKAQAARHATRH